MIHIIYLTKRFILNNWRLPLLLLWSINGYATLTVSLDIDNCMNPIPNAGTYTNAGIMNGKPYFTKGANLRILWSGTQWEFQGDDPSISGVNWVTGWYNTNDTPFPPQTEWTSSFGCFLPTMSGDETTPLCNISATSSVTDVSCFGGSDGTATVNVTGGVSPYTYSWSPAGGTAATATSLVAGGYTVVIMDANLCSTTQFITINEPSLITGVAIHNICTGSSYTFNDIIYTSSNNTATDTFTSGNGCDSIVTLNLTVSENGIATTNTSGTAIQYNDTARFANAACEMIATLGSAVDLGSITGMVTLTGIVPAGGDPYVSRYYDIQTTQSGGGTLTLFYTQQEFDDYNTFVGAGNPDYPQIGPDGAGLQITAFHSMPGSGDGPGGYDTSAANVEAIPCTAVWNAVANRWEVTFTTTQFSGFFLHTKSDGTPLPIKLTELSVINLGAINKVDWRTGEETEGDIFIVERSADGKLFYEIGRILATGMPGNAYSFPDEMPLDGINYYRLHFLNVDGTEVYSKVVSASATGELKICTAPNPFSMVIHMGIDGQMTDDAIVTISNAIGMTIWKSAHISSNMLTIETENWPAGVYWLHFVDGARSEVLKMMKH